VPALVSLEAIREAAAIVRQVARLTPLIPASSDPAWSHLALKCENLQVVGSFKTRGAWHFASRLDSRIRAHGLVTYSSGNHGQAVAYAASRLGVPAIVVMPTTASAVKVEGARRLGAEVHFAGTVTIERRAAAERLERERGLAMVPPFDHPDIIAGQGTIGLEIFEQQPDTATVYVPVGGGGLIAGVAAAVKGLRRGVRVVGVEPEGAAKMTCSLAAGTPTTLDRVESMADGLLPVRPGDLTFAHVRALVDDVVTVTEAEIADAVRFLAGTAKLVAEPSGAVSTAAAMRLAPPGSPGVHVAVISGGNVAAARLATLLRGQETPSAR
jgi:threonine dehydratase